MTVAKVEDSSLRAFPEFDHHAAVYRIVDTERNLTAYVGIHRQSATVPSFGATRLWRYETETEALRDVLRLSRLMSYKAALASLPCGGAKGVIVEPKGTYDRRTLLAAYADGIRELAALFVTGTDVGILQEDLPVLKERAPNIIGFSDNSTHFTVLGIEAAMRECLRHTFQTEEFKGRSFSIQGLGKIGSGVLRAVYADAREIFVAETNEARLEEIRHEFPRVIPLDPALIHRKSVDVFSPSALSDVVTLENAGDIGARIIAGGANNQLQNDEAGDALYERGILYAPDFVVNAGGLIAVFDEFENPSYDEERVRAKVLAIPALLRQILRESKETHRAPSRVASDLAEREFNQHGSALSVLYSQA